VADPITPLRRGEPFRLGRYDLLGRLGQGGMGTVFLARIPDGRLVAVKMMRPELAHDEEFLGRFRSELNRMLQVPPFSTAAVLDADPDHDPPYLVMEYVDGPSLSTVVRDSGVLTGSTLHGLAAGMATALSAIHGAGVIHRDLKPDNVLLARGGLKVIDFGIARAFEATSQHTRTDHLVGTVAYMAPERFDPVDERPVTSAADIFAWGALVTFAATGRTPFAAESPPATAMRILTQPPRLDGLPGTLRDLVESALSKVPEDRPTARDLLSALEAAQAPPVAARPRPEPMTEVIGRPGRPPARRPRRRLLLLVAGLVVTVLVATAAGLALRPPEVPMAVAGRPPASDPYASLPGIGRRTQIRAAEIKSHLSLDRHDSEVTATDGDGVDSLFVLDRAGRSYLIRSLRSEGHPRDTPTCVGVKLVPQGGAALQADECRRSPATLFTLTPTGAQDDQGRPTFHISNDTYGYALWSPERNTVVVDKRSAAGTTTGFSFSDRGPV